MRVLVTGATGHIGAHVVRAALDAGQEVVAFHRRGSDARGLHGLPIESRHGDLTRPDEVRAAVDGCDGVYHVGATHRNWAPTDEAFEGPNVEGTRNVLVAAREAGVRRVVVTSSQATVGYTEDPGTPLDETCENAHLDMAYVRTKVEAERVALTLGATGPEVVVVNPTATCGPLDYRKTPTSAACCDLFAGGPVLFGINVVHVEDVARGHVLAMERGTPGQRYLLGGENLLRDELVALVARVVHGQPNTLQPPWLALAVAARVMPLVSRLTGRDPSITPEALTSVWGRHMLYDTSKARRELGYTSRSAEETLHDTLHWAVFMGWLSAKVVDRVDAADRTPDPSWVTPTSG